MKLFQTNKPWRAVAQNLMQSVATRQSARWLRYALVIGAALGGILLFLLASASANTDLFERHYSTLLVLNALFALALLALVLLLLTRLLHRLRVQEFGSKLRARMVLLFTLIGVLPGTVIYLISVQFVSKSIESWFDVKVETALESGLTLARTSLDAMLADLNFKARSMARELAENEIAQSSVLSHLRDLNQIQEATLISANSKIIATAGGRLAALVPDLPPLTALQQARLTNSYSAIEGGALDGSNDGKPENSSTPLKMRVIVALPARANLFGGTEIRYLQILQPVPSTLAKHAESVRQAYREYQERSLARSGLRKIYLITLTLTLLLAVLGAISLAFLMSTRLSHPLLQLAQGVQAVAQGDLRARNQNDWHANDELGSLNQSFNHMTVQLSDARDAVNQQQAKLADAKAYLESVLANLSAGVMVFDAEFKLVSANQGAAHILQADIHARLGASLEQALVQGEFVQAARAAFAELNARQAFSHQPEKLATELAANNEPKYWQRQIELSVQAPLTAGESEGATVDAIHAADKKQTLLARGSRLPIGNQSGYILVFDDISAFISAQRQVAWSEVARRLAHEIKNPLTPIRLSAERLQKRLHEKLPVSEQEVLIKASTTIINQVVAMQHMVDDFRDFARQPAAHMQPLDLNELIADVLNLYASEQQQISAQLAHNLPLILGDATQLRQVVHNLLQNALDALETSSALMSEGAVEHNHDSRVSVSTEVVQYRVGQELQSAVRLMVSDQGSGFPAKILAHAFEPYVTTKPRGTGLGLAVVKKILDEHAATISLSNLKEVDAGVERGTFQGMIAKNGARVTILFLRLV